LGGEGTEGEEMEVEEWRMEDRAGQDRGRKDSSSGAENRRKRKFNKLLNFRVLYTHLCTCYLFGQSNQIKSNQIFIRSCQVLVKLLAE